VNAILRYFSMFVGLTVTAAIAHLIGRRAEENGRHYWVWFLLAMPLGPPGAAIVFFLLEASIHKQSERETEQESTDKMRSVK
jgi:Na+-driven multidrug efflux pump